MAMPVGYMRMLGVLCCALAFLGPVQAQLPKALGSWNIVNVRYALSGPWSLFGEAQLRSLKFYDHFHYHEVKGGLTYRAYPNLRISLAVGKYDTYRVGGDFVTPKNNSEIRLWPQVSLTQSAGDLAIEHRYRAELRFTSNGYRNRFRYRLGLLYPLLGEREGAQSLHIGIGNELFLTDKAPYFERNRFNASLTYRLSPTLSAMAGYLRQFDYNLNDEIGHSFLQLGWYLELAGKASKPASGFREDN
jgi:hypothetical protein